MYVYKHIYVNSMSYTNNIFTNFNWSNYRTHFLNKGE